MKRLVALVLCVVLCLAMGMEACRAGAECKIDLPRYWREVEGNDLLISFEVKNYYDEIIDAVDIAVYAENAYGEAMYQDDGKSGLVRCYSCDITTIQPGRSKKSGYCELTGLKSAKKVYMAVYRCHFKNGTTLEFADNTKTDWKDKLDYWSCTFK